jgi:predicted transcriptional regulator
MKAILSIKPKYAERILSGEKEYEYRKRIFRSEDVSRVVMYATQPVSRLVGEFGIERILRDNPEDLWNRTSDAAGLSWTQFNSYFQNRSTGVAIEISQADRFSPPVDPWETIEDFHPPQSFCYWYTQEE